MPRSALGAQRVPCAATYTTSSFFGCTMTRLICRVFSRPMRFQVRPASVLLYTPSPHDDDCPRTACSPVPTYTTFGSSGATAIAPTLPIRKQQSDTLRQLLPASSVFHTPPPVKPA